MKRRVITLVSLVLACFSFAGCSNLFENLINEDLSFKKGDDSLLPVTEATGENAITSSGIVVIKNSEKNKTQILYNPNQKIYFVGKVPAGYSDFKVDYQNGTNISLLGKDDPVELKCYPNDSNTKVVWTLTQTWQYLAQEEVRTTKDSDGNEVTYRGIKAQKAEKLESPLSVNYKIESKKGVSILTSDLPYGVTVATCTVIADDAAYQTEYKIILTKEYITTIADSNPDADANNTTDHGLVVIKASDPGRNAINYSSTIYEYEVGDSSGANPALDLTGRDDPLVFKCFMLDENAELTWKAVQTKEYQPVWDSDNHGILSQTLKDFETPLAFDFVDYDDIHEGTAPFMHFLSNKKNEVKSNLPYGVTEVYVTITAYNTDLSGKLLPNVTQYKITLTKRYIITAAAGNSAKGNEAGLAVYANGKNGNLINYKPDLLNYSIENLSGANDPVKIEFRPEEPLFIDLSWTATQTHSYEPKIYSVSNGNTTYTYQSGGEFVELNNPVNLLAAVAGTSAPLSVSSDGQLAFCQGNLPYGTTLVTVNVKSQDDKNSSTTYKIILKKKQVSTNINIVSSDGDEMSTVTDRGLVVLGAQNESLNKISFNPSKFEYTVGGLQAADNDMKFRCYLADSDAKITWQMIQTKSFEAKKSVYEKEITDALLGTKETVRYEYISGQTESACEVPVTFSATENISANEIKASIPYGITEVTARITSENESTTVYKITLRRDICAEPISEEDFVKSLEEGSGEGNYSQLKELNLTIAEGDSSSTAKLEPEFSPSHTSYTLTVDEEADSILIDAIAADMNAEVSDPVVVTKYGEVPAVDGMKVNLVGGTTRITFKVKDETGISRTYTIYIDKPEDGDTTLSSLTNTPAQSFANGLKGFVFDDSFKGLDKDKASGAAKYNMTLSADSRVDVREVEFTAVPNNKRTVVSYGISNSISTLPAEWSDNFKWNSVRSCSVEIGDEDLADITRVLWIRTISDEYYHLKEDKKSYEKNKRADTTYHKVLLTKAGNNNQNLTALVIRVINENEKLEKEYRYTSKDTVAFKTIDKEINVSTYADKIEFYFRPLDKDAKVTYSAENTKWDTGDGANTNFEGYSLGSEVEKTSGTCDYLTDGSSEYYKLTIGSIEPGVDTKTDLPRGTTKVKLLGKTYTFVKPDYTSVSYGIDFGDVDRKWDNYIYLKDGQTELKMTITTAQQDQTVSIGSCTYTKDSLGNDASDASGKDPIIEQDFTQPQKETAPTNWEAKIRNIHPGTTELVVHVTNKADGAEKDVTYFIICPDNTDTRLKNLSFGTASFNAYTAAKKEGDTGNDYTYEIKEPLLVDAGKQTLKVEPVNEKAIIKIERQHHKSTKVNAYNAEGWSDRKTVVAESEENRAYDDTFTEENADQNAGSILYTITVSSSDSEAETHIYYLIIHVKADTTAQLNALSIIQKGDEKDRTILSNSFDPETLDYPELFASLNYTGDIIIKPTVYPKAKITTASLSCEGQEYNQYIGEKDVITIPYDVYKDMMGKTYNISYTVQAQDGDIEPVVYTVELKIPEYEYKEIRETKEVITEKSFTVPDGFTSGLAYRFGSLISDNTQANGFFGGIDIIGTSDGTKWYESSFGGSGFQFVLNIEGKDYWAELADDGTGKGKLVMLYTYDGTNKPVKVLSEDGEPDLKDIKLTVTPKFISENKENYLELSLTVDKGNLTNVKLGAAIDTLIGTIDEAALAANDSVTVEETNNGFTMKSSDYSFSVILKNAYNVTDVSDLWYGFYNGGKYLTQVFEPANSSAKKKGLKEGQDSAASFWWELENGTSTVTKTIRISMDRVN